MKASSVVLTVADGERVQTHWAPGSSGRARRDLQQHTANYGGVFAAYGERMALTRLEPLRA
jgi:hypothetical protein